MSTNSLKKASQKYSNEFNQNSARMPHVHIMKAHLCECMQIEAW